MSAFRANVKTFIDTGFDDCENVRMYDIKDVHILHQREITLQFSSTVIYVGAVE